MARTQTISFALPYYHMLELVKVDLAAPTSTESIGQPPAQVAQAPATSTESIGLPPPIHALPLPKEGKGKQATVLATGQGSASNMSDDKPKLLDGEANRMMSHESLCSSSESEKGPETFLKREDQHHHDQPRKGKGRARGNGRGKGKGRGKDKAKQQQSKDNKTADEKPGKKQGGKGKTSDKSAKQAAQGGSKRGMKRPAAAQPESPRSEVYNAYMYTRLDAYWSRPAVGLKYRENDQHVPSSLHDLEKSFLNPQKCDISIQRSKGLLPCCAGGHHGAVAGDYVPSRSLAARCATTRPLNMVVSQNEVTQINM